MDAFKLKQIACEITFRFKPSS